MIVSSRLFRILAHATFIFTSAYLYIVVVQLWAVRWESYFMRSGNIFYYFYLLVFTIIYVQIMKLLWKWHVRAFSGP